MNNIEEKVKKIFVELFPELILDDFKLSKKQCEFDNWDSFAHLELIVRLEKEFNISIDIGDALDADSAQSLVEIITNKLGKPADDISNSGSSDQKENLKNLSQVLSYWANKIPDKDFLIDLSSGKRYSYSNFDALVNQTVRFLYDQGVAPHDVIFLCLKNSIEFLLVYFASIRLGSVVHPIPATAGEAELRADLEFISPKLIIATAGQFEKIAEDRNVWPVEFEGNNSFLNTISDYGNDKIDWQLNEDDISCLYYSSGTTSAPKAIACAHHNQIDLVASCCRGFGHTSNTIHLGILPMAHTAIINYSLLPTLYMGGTMVFAENFMKIRKDFWQIIKEYGITYVETVPTVIYLILNTAYPDYDRQQLKLKYVACGSAALAPKLQSSFKQMFDLPISNKYGLSETGQMTFDNPLDPDRPSGTVGKPLDIVEMIIIDDSGNEVPMGQVGEIAVKSKGLLGYYKNDDYFSACFKNGYFCTGDLGKIDENGYVFYVDRKKDLIIKGGVNIAPNLIDEVLLTHEAVAEAATIGISDEFMGEIIKSFVVLIDNSFVTKEDLIAYCQEQLGKFKTPSEIEFIDNIPKGSSGKILKRQLREIDNYKNKRLP